MLLAKPVVKKEPVSAENLRAIYSTNMSDLGDVHIYTATLCLSCVCFSGFLRFAKLSELHCSDVTVSEEHMKITIRNSKTDQYRRGNEIVIARMGNKTCPASADDGNVWPKLICIEPSKVPNCRSQERYHIQEHGSWCIVH